ncbi:MAG: hypothetical protein ABH846_04055 [Patescibacteria group bacterium]
MTSKKLLINGLSTPKKRLNVMLENNKNRLNIDRAVIIISALLIIVNTLIDSPWFLKMPFFIIWVFFVAWTFGSRLASKINRFEQLLFGLLFLLSAAGILLSITYLSLFINVWIVCLIVLVFTLLAINQIHEPFPVISKIKLPEWRDWTSILISTVVIGDACLIILYTQIQTNEAIMSPWDYFGLAPFILFTITTWALIMIAKERKDNLSVWLSIFHFFTAFSVATIAYKYGFGFDPFLHRAAEEAIYSDWALNPKQLLYTGQYTLVVALKYLTGLSIWNLDRWLLSLLASLTLPPIAFFSLRDGWKMGSTSAKMFIPVILIFPFLPLVFTVPNNLTILMLLWVIFLLPLRNKLPQLDILLFSIGVFALLVHPLIGVPTFLLTTFYIIWDRAGDDQQLIKRFIEVIFLIAIITVVPILFAVYNFLQGQDPIINFDIFSRFENFLGLFKDPFQPPWNVPLIWEILYDFSRYGSLFISAAALLIYSLTQIQQKLPARTPYCIFYFGSFIMLILLSTLFIFKDIISYEQSEFAFRVLQSLYFVTIPFIIFFLHRLWQTKIYQSYIIQSVTALLLASMITVSWYMSYPQSNPKNISSGPGVRQADIEAVHFLEDLSNGKPYFVLSNQMTSAAAIQEFGFAQYFETPNGSELWYAIPTGGPMYQYYLEMFYGPSREIMQQASDFSGIETGYYLIYDYWQNEEDSWQQELKAADNRYVIDESRVIIIEYDFKN